MNMKRMSKVLSLVLLLGMLLSLLPAAAFAADSATAELKESIAAGDKVVIYYPKESKVASTTEILYNEKKLELEALDATVADGKMTVPEGAAILTVQVNDDGQYSFVTDEGKYLYADGTHVQFVDEAGENTLFVLEDTTSADYAGHFIRCATANYNGKAQYLEYYGGYFSVYGMNNSNADIYTFQFFALESAEEPQPTYNTVAEALAGEEGAEFTVKAVVTMIDGKNVYVQDATGGICLYFSAAPTGLALGDTVIGSGKRMTYKNLPELGEASFEKSEGLTLEAKETTIDALTTADVCTYVKLSDLTVTEVYDNNGQYSSPNVKVADAEGHEIQIYKAVVGKTGDDWDVKVEDKVDVTAAVGVNNTTLQLRNTLASEITVRQPEVKGDRITDLSELTDGLTVAIYSPSHKTSVSAKPNGDWYLKANPATVENGKVQNFTQEDIWTVKLNENGTYSFYAYGDETRSITVWPSGSYAELSLNVATYPDNTWSLAPAVTEDCFYMSSATLTGTNRDGETGPAYVEAYIRNGTEVFSG